MLFRISKFFLYASAFTVVLVSLSTLFPFIVGKYAYFRAVVDLALIFFLAGLMLNPEGPKYLAVLRERFRSPLVIAVTVFAAMFVLAGFFGVRPSFSFWSNFERGEGGLQILHLYAFFVLLITLFRDDANWRRLFWLSTVGAALMILYGVLAGLGTSIGGWGVVGQTFGSPNFRFNGSVGNSAYVTGYLVFALFFAAYLLIGQRRSLRSAQSLTIIGFMILFFIFAFMSGTRGGLFGIIAGGGAALVYMAWHRKPWRKWLLAIAIVGLIGLGFLFQFRDTPFVQGLPGGRLFHFSLEDADVADRLTMWRIAVDGWRARPILGWGPENFLMLFDRHFNPHYFHPDVGLGAWFDRAHSVFFDYLAQTGALGLASYLAIFACVAFLLLRRRARDAAREDPRRLLIQALFLWVIIAYLVQGLVLFDVLVLYLPLFTLFAFAVHYFTPAPPERAAPERASVPNTPKSAVCLAGIVLAVLSLYFGALLPFLKGRIYINAQRQVASVRTVEEFKQNFDEVFDFYSPVGTEEVTKFLATNIQSFVQAGQVEEVDRELVSYIEGRLFPDEVRHILSAAQLRQILWSKYGAEEDYLAAVSYYQKAREIGPNLPPPLYSLFSLYIARGDAENAEKIAALILANWPEDKEFQAFLESNE